MAQVFEERDDFESGDIRDDEIEPVGAVTEPMVSSNLTKSELLKIKNLNVTALKRTLDFDYYKELLGESRYTWVTHLQSVYDQSAFFFDGTITFTVKKYRASKVTPLMLLTTLRGSKKYQAVKWHQLREN